MSSPSCRNSEDFSWIVHSFFILKYERCGGPQRTQLSAQMKLSTSAVQSNSSTCVRRCSNALTLSHFIITPVSNHSCCSVKRSSTASWTRRSRTASSSPAAGYSVAACGSRFRLTGNHVSMKRSAPRWSTCCRARGACPASEARPGSWYAANNSSGVQIQLHSAIYSYLKHRFSNLPTSDKWIPSLGCLWPL